MSCVSLKTYTMVDILTPIIIHTSGSAPPTVLDLPIALINLLKLGSSVVSSVSAAAPPTEDVEERQQVLLLTLVLAARGVMDIPTIKDWASARHALQQVGGDSNLWNDL